MLQEIFLPDPVKLHMIPQLLTYESITFHAEVSARWLWDSCKAAEHSAHKVILHK